MTKPDRHYQDLMHRALKNYDFVKCRATDDGPYEVTQLLGTFLCAVAYPRERALERELKELSLHDAEERFELPRISIFSNLPSVPGKRGLKPDENVGDLAEVLRHGVAHGNVLFFDDEERPEEIVEIQLANRYGGSKLHSARIPVKLLEDFVRRFVDIADHFFEERYAEWEKQQAAD